MNTFITIILLFAMLQTQAQMHNGKFGNEWIQHHQNYFKIKVIEEGFYRIPNPVLARDIPYLDTINPSSFELFYLGKTVPIYVHQVQGQIQYIDFYAHTNNASLDQQLYDDLTHHFNPSYSLISDSCAYFLTWSNGQDSRYENKALDFNNIHPHDSFFVYHTKHVFKQQWSEGKRYLLGGNQFSKSSFESGEGFGSGLSTQHTKSISCPYLFSNTAVLPVFEAKVYSQGYTHQIQVKINNYIHIWPSFSQDSFVRIRQTIPHSALASNNSIQLAKTSNSNNQLNISEFGLKYPRAFNFGGQHCFRFELSARTNKKLLKVDNFEGGNANNTAMFLYDLTNRQRTPCWWDGQTLQSVLWPSNTSTDMVLINTDSIRRIHVLNEVKFKNHQQSAGDYIIISHPNLMQDAAGGNPIFDYAAYRSLTGYAVSIHNILELYDQFSYGIHGHPLAIKNFVAYIEKNWIPAPQHIFLIGKGRKYQTIRHDNQPAQLIPSFGFPPSDNLLVAPTNSSIPTFPVGRLSVTQALEIYQYLDKVKAIEQNEPSDESVHNQHWRKRIMHLSGGAYTQEYYLFKYYLDNLASFVRYGDYPKNIFSFSKIQDQFTVKPTTESIDSLINQGVSMISFFGHGSSQGFDYYLNNPNYYSNENKYPHILAMGCHNGTIYEANPQLSEKFVLAEKSGAISYLSFVDVVFANCAYLIGSSFYNLSQSSHATAGIGRITQQTLEQLSAMPGDMYELAGQYLVLHGDPALKINPISTPDLAVDSNYIRTIPTSIQSSDRLFQLELEVFNWGRKKDSIIDLKIIHQLPSGKQVVHYKQCYLSSVQKSIQLSIPVEGYASIGWHHFSVHINYENRINEGPLSRRLNNRIYKFPVHVSAGPVLAAYPKEFAIINQAQAHLKAVHPNALQTLRTWFFELDTTPEFDSPSMIPYRATSISNIHEWEPNLVLQEGQVYYWRVRSNHDNQKDICWSASSFVYLPGRDNEGWNQSHFHQYKKNSFQQLLPPSYTDAAFRFEASTGEIAVQSGYINQLFQNNAFQLLHNGSIVDKCRCPDNNGIYVAVFNPTDKSFWSLPAGNNSFGALNCDPAGRTAYAFLFDNSTNTGKQDLSNFIRHTVPNDHLVFMYTLNNGYGNNLEQDLVVYLRQIGALQIDSFLQQPTMPYAVSFYKNNQVPQLHEKLGNNQAGMIKVNNRVPEIWHEGSMQSPLIGPATAWKGFEYALNDSNISTSDSASVQIWGLNERGEHQLLRTHIQASYVDIRHIDAQQFPFIYLKFINSDTQHRTASTLNYWRVYAQLNHDLALSIRKSASVNYDSIPSSNGLQMTLQIENNSPIDIAHQQLTVYLNQQDSIELPPVAIPAFQSIEVPIDIPLEQYEGLQHLVVHLKSLQQESYLLNNWGWMDIHVYPNDVYDDIATKPSRQTQIRAYPNPFVLSTTIEVSLDEDIDVFDCLIFDMNGRLIQRLRHTNQGNNQIVWDGLSQSGQVLPAGNYYGQIITKKQSTDQSKSQAVLKLIKN